MANKKVESTNQNILNAVRSQLSYEVQNHLPKVTSDNISQVYDDILRYNPLRNEVVPALVRLIGMLSVDSVAWRNPLARYKKNPMRYGETEEETYVNMCKGHVYDPRDSFEKAFQIYESYIMSVFHNINLKIQYPVTVTFDNLRNAFFSEYGIRDMISAKMESAVTGANWDEYLAMKQLIDAGYNKQVLPAVTVPKVVDEDTAKKMLVEVKTAIGEFAFPNPANNIAGSTASSRPENIVFITTPRTNANISVQALAYAYQLDRAQVEVNTVVVDSFANDAIQAVVCDVRFFKVREQLREISDQRLANVLSWNYFYTMLEMVSASPFYPIKVFTTDTVETTANTITASNGNYTSVTDNEIQIPASVTGGSGTYHQELLTYGLVSGNTSRDTFIVPGTNILHIGAGETGSLVIDILYRPDETVTKQITYTKSV